MKDGLDTMLISIVNGICYTLLIGNNFAAPSCRISQKLNETIDIVQHYLLKTQEKENLTADKSAAEHVSLSPDPGANTVCVVPMASDVKEGMRQHSGQP